MIVTRLLVAAAGLALAAGARAEQAWITERIEVGVHQARAADSPILVLLPSGTPLEVLAREEGAVEVRTAEGIEGWIDARYLSSDPPAGRRLAEQGRRLETLTGELEAARARLAELEERLGEAEARARSAEQSLLAAEQEQQARAAAQRETDQAASEALRELQRLAEDNQRLKQRISELEAAQAMLAERAEQVAPPAGRRDDPAPARRVAAGLPAALAESGYRLLLSWPRWVWLLLGSLALLAFALGAWLIDWDQRRRHGGFRI